VLAIRREQRAIEVQGMARELNRDQVSFLASRMPLNCHRASG
jgi:hypothetical protein